LPQKEDLHRLIAHRLTKARGNVLERKDYEKALEHAKKAVGLLEELIKLKNQESLGSETDE